MQRDREREEEGVMPMFGHWCMSQPKKPIMGKSLIQPSVKH